MKRWFLILTLLLVLSVTASQAENDSQPPTLRLETEQLHAGDVAAGSMVEGIFRFENLSDHPIRILRAKPT